MSQTLMSRRTKRRTLKSHCSALAPCRAEVAALQQAAAVAARQEADLQEDIAAIQVSSGVLSPPELRLKARL